MEVHNKFMKRFGLQHFFLKVMFFFLGYKKSKSTNIKLTTGKISFKLHLLLT